MNKIIRTFIHFAENEAKTSSPLYYYWCKEIVHDEEMLQLIAKIPSSQPKPNLFFASVQFVLSKTEDNLKKYVPSFTNNPLPIEGSYILLKDFVKKHCTELENCFNTKLVQTNEVRRSAYLYPIFSKIAKNTNKPLALIEIGTSAGLLLNLDQYHYEIKQGNDVIYFGNATSEVSLKSENLGNQLAIYPSFQVSDRYGIDLNIIQLHDEEDYLWMKALIWPEHKERRALFNKLAKMNSTIDKTLLEGDMIEILPSIINNISEASQIVIFHTHVANQFSQELKENFEQLLLKLSQGKSIYHVYNNMNDGDLHVDSILDGHIEQEQLLQKPDGHGNYFYW